MNIPELRHAGHVRRCHGTQTIGHQTVAEHSYGVAMLVVALYKGQPPVDVLKAALYHDLAEVYTGDVPAPAKWKSEKLSAALTEMEVEFEHHFGIYVDLTDEERLVLKYADGIELGHYCVDQLMLGNRNMLKMFDSIMQYMRELPFHDEADRQIQLLLERYHAYTCF